MGLTKRNQTSFKIGNIPWNKGNGKNKKYKFVRIAKGWHMHEHIYKWLQHNQLHRVPDGCVIHHLDGDTLNNNINNLQLLTKDVHDKLHWEVRRLHLLVLQQQKQR